MLKMNNNDPSRRNEECLVSMNTRYSNRALACGETLGESLRAKPWRS